MRTIFVAALAALLLPLLPRVALAQGGPVQQSGAMTPGHPAMFITNGVIGDGGPALRGKLKELGITNTGTPLCINDAPITGPYHQLCLGAGVITSNSYGGAAQQPLTFNINGVDYPFVTTGGNVTGTGTVNTLAVWNGGNLLKDSSTASLPAGVTVLAQPTGPSSWTALAQYDALRVATNGFPTGAQFGGGTVPNYSSLTGTILVPAAAGTAGSTSWGVSGYATSLNAAATASGVGGFGNLSVAGGGVWGGTFQINNCPNSGTCAANSGLNPGNMTGVESDVNLVSLAAGSVTGLVAGYVAIGASTIAVPTTATSAAYYTRALGYNVTPKIPWNVAFYSEDAAATIGLQLGAAKAAGNNVDSQTVRFVSYNATGVGLEGQFYQDRVGDWNYNLPNSGGGHNFQLNSEGLATINTSGLTLFPENGGVVANNDSLSLLWSAVTPAGATVQAKQYLTATNALVTLLGATAVMELTASPTSAQTSLLLNVVNNAGVTLAPVTLGAVDSGGTGFRSLRVPN